MKPPSVTAEYLKLAKFAECLITASQFFGRIAVSIHNALNRMFASGTGKDLQLVSKIVIGMRTASR
jgi:hypothetical protein